MSFCARSRARTSVTSKVKVARASSRASASTVCRQTELTVDAIGAGYPAPPKKRGTGGPRVRRARAARVRARAGGGGGIFGPATGSSVRVH